MSIAAQIQRKLANAFAPTHLEVIDESHMHRMQATASHFKVIIVSDAFADLRLIQAHQAVYQVLHEEMQQVHALALHTYEPKNWPVQPAELRSPPCIKK